MTLLKLAVLEC